MKLRKTDILHKKSKRRLRSSFILVTAIIMVIVVAITVLLEWAIMSTGWVDATFQNSAWLAVAVAVGFVSICTGIGLSLLTSRIVMRPMNELLDGMHKLSEGDFDTRITYKGPYDLEQIFDGFNALAQELKNVEIFRSDFINNFSHEFKTPVNSINGLIGLLKEKNLPREKQLEYLGVIEEETRRLSLITTNILDLSKLDNQGILTNMTEYNVSEQIRMCVLFLEKQWTQKNLNLSMDFDEYTITADEDMMKQVWFNLLDNAIKFANEGGELGIDMTETDGVLQIKISDEGPEIPEADRERIFNKFYQTDKTHSQYGNGIGLSIVKRIVELHEGTISAGRENDKTVFTVALPL